MRRDGDMILGDQGAPFGSGSRRSDQAASHLDPAGFDPLRKEVPHPAAVERLVGASDIQGAMAYWAYVQHPFDNPPLLTDIIALIDRAAKRTFELQVPISHWFGSSREIMKWLREEVQQTYPTASMIFKTWNTPRSGHSAEVVFTSRYGGPSPENDFIDIDALFNNVARMAWEHSADYERPASCDEHPMGEDRASGLSAQHASAVCEAETPSLLPLTKAAEQKVKELEDYTGLIERLAKLDRARRVYLDAVQAYNDRLKSERDHGSFPPQMGDLYQKMEEGQRAWLELAQSTIDEGHIDRAAQALLSSHAREAALVAALEKALPQLVGPALAAARSALAQITEEAE